MGFKPPLWKKGGVASEAPPFQRGGGLTPAPLKGGRGGVAWKPPPLSGHEKGGEGGGASEAPPPLAREGGGGELQAGAPLLISRAPRARSIKDSGKLKPRLRCVDEVEQRRHALLL